MYALIFWGLILPIFAFPIRGVDLIPAIGLGMVAYGSWILSRQRASFVATSITAAALVLNALCANFLPGGPQVIQTVFLLSVALRCLMGWFLLTSVSEDCQKNGQFDIAARARVARIIYVSLFIVSPLAFYFVASLPPHFSPALLVLPLIISLTGYAILVWTVQSAKVRLYP